MKKYTHCPICKSENFVFEYVPINIDNAFGDMELEISKK